MAERNQIAVAILFHRARQYASAVRCQMCKQQHNREDQREGSEPFPGGDVTNAVSSLVLLLCGQY